MPDEEWVAVTEVQDMRNGDVRIVRVGHVEVALFRLADGSFAALENRCPHRGGPLAEGIRAGCHVFCPLHDWKIDVRTGVVQYPDEGSVQTFAVNVVGGIVSMNVGPCLEVKR